MPTLNLWRQSPNTTQPLMRPAEPEPAPRALRPLLRIVVLNTKGGCGKTTLSTNLAGYYASHEFNTALLDMDPQGSSLRWLANRAQKRAPVTGIQGTERGGRVTRSFQLRIPPGTERLIVDTPAGLEPMRLQDVTRGADAILIPVLPSDIDIHAASRCIADLLIAGRIERRADRVAVIA
ncbi:MAG: ParA family protein, partial [Gammaproteobacteria bacterium]